MVALSSSLLEKLWRRSLNLETGGNHLLVSRVVVSVSNVSVSRLWRLISSRSRHHTSYLQPCPPGQENNSAFPTVKLPWQFSLTSSRICEINQHSRPRNRTRHFVWLTIVMQSAVYVRHPRQESCAIAKMTAQCALYTGSVKICWTPWLQ